VRQSTIRRVAACMALASSVGATAATVVVATGASAFDPPGAAMRPPAGSADRPPLPAPRDPVRLVWVGDTMFGHGTTTAPDGGDALFAHVRDSLRAADVTFGNLEGVLATGGVSKCGAQPSENCFAFRAPPSTAAALRRAGFDVMNVANNHAWDYGSDGQAQTLAALRSQRIAYAGLPDGITVLRRHGLRVAFVGFAPYPWASSLLDIPRARSLIRAADRRAEIVVAAMHAGAEGSAQTRTPQGREVAFGEDRGETRAFAHAAVDAGADLVVGSGPHVVRGMERYRGRVIAYSLGNFAGWHNFGTGGALSLTGILDITLDAAGRPLRGGLTSLLITPPGVPVQDPARGTARLVDELSAADFGSSALDLSPEGRMLLDR
jgi:Bacterial capsule synthesis protein PGA_cap